MFESLRERELSSLWEGGNLPPAAMITMDGTPLQIVYRGRPNAGAGPDFRDAIVALPDGSLLHGDVELHVRAVDFRRHGHQRDPAYNHVVLHVVLHGDDGVATALASGRLVPVVALERWLTARAGELEAMLRQPALWREPCQDAVERMGAANVETVLARLGERRLRLRAASIGGRVTSEALYGRLLRTLGHGAGMPAWVELARRIPPALLLRAGELESGPPARTIEALLLGAGRLLAPVEGSWEPSSADPYLRESVRIWKRQGAPAGLEIAAAGPLRPANHPARRLAGVARLLADGPETLLARLRAAVLSEAQPERKLVAALTVPADGPWRDRVLPWSGPAPSQPPALIGAGKALELALNAALPVILAVAEREGNWRLADAGLGCFHALPSPPAYGRTAHLYRALKQDGRQLIRRADASQAALHLYANYCTRGGCGRCPLS
jgi:hypothetical protein